MHFGRQAFSAADRPTGGSGELTDAALRVGGSDRIADNSTGPTTAKRDLQMRMRSGLHPTSLLYESRDWGPLPSSDRFDRAFSSDSACPKVLQKCEELAALL